MRKQLLLCLTLPVILTGCHGHMLSSEAINETTVSEGSSAASETTADANDNKPSDILSEFDTSKHYEITFWAKNDTNKAQVDIYNKAISDFEQSYPNIKVNIKTYTDYGAIYNDVITNIATNTTPNVCITYPDHIATYITGSETVTDLTPYMSDSRYGFGGSEVRFDSVTREEIVSEFLEEGIIGNKQYALPFMRSTEICYVNKTYVEKLGYTLPDILTWDFVWEVSEAAMKKDADGNFAVNGQKVMIPFIYKSTDNMMITMLKQLSAPYSDSDGNIYIFNDTTRDILKQTYKYGADRSFSTFKISSYPANFLNAGQCIFAVDSSAGATWMGSDAPLVDIADDKLVKFETAVLTVPQYDTSKPAMMSQGPSVCVFNKKDEGEVMASWLFAQFLLTNEVQIAYSETEGYIPVTKKAQDSSEYQDYLSKAGSDNSKYYDVKIKSAKLLIANTSNTFVTAVFNGSANLRNAAGQLIEDAVKAGRRSQSFGDTDIDKEFSDIISLFKLNKKSIKDAASAPTDASDSPESEAASVENSTTTPQSTSASASEADPEDEKDLGKLPTASYLLLISLVIIWILILISVIFNIIKAKRNNNSCK